MAKPSDPLARPDDDDARWGDMTSTERMVFSSAHEANVKRLLDEYCDAVHRTGHPARTDKGSNVRFLELIEEPDFPWRWMPDFCAVVDRACTRDGKRRDIKFVEAKSSGDQYEFHAINAPAYEYYPTLQKGLGRPIVFVWEDYTFNTLDELPGIYKDTKVKDGSYFCRFHKKRGHPFTELFPLSRNGEAARSIRLLTLTPFVIPATKET